MKRAKVLLLPGDGIGEEVVREAEKILGVIAETKKMALQIEKGLIGGASLKATGKPITEATLRKAKSCKAVLLGAVGDPQWDLLAPAQRPEQGLLRIRKELRLFANLRPVRVCEPLLGASPLKKEVVEGADFIVVRELTGGIYFGRPRGIRKTPNGERGYNTEVYTRKEIERISRVAFETAQRRRRKVTSVDKANVLESSALWRRIVKDVHNGYPDVELNHLYVDNAAMQIIKSPRQFDVILTNNLFGDILSDEAAMVAGSIGMLASASLGGKVGLYEPIHGSAPDIAGKNKANPLGAILSVALMCRHSLGENAIADAIEKAVESILAEGCRTTDIAGEGDQALSTSEMGDKVKTRFQANLAGRR